jgi:hypothetical protein
MSPVGAGNFVPLVEQQTDAGGDGLFARVKVDEAGNLTGGEFHVKAFLKCTDQRHDPVSL